MAESPTTPSRTKQYNRKYLFCIEPHKYYYFMKELWYTDAIKQKGKYGRGKKITLS